MPPSPSVCPDLRAGKPIPLDELRDACAEYDQRSVGRMNYNRWLREFRDLIGIDLECDESQKLLDLTKREHGKALILLLNQWGCHIPSRIPRHYEAMLKGLGDWWRSREEAPLPTPHDRLTDGALDLATIATRLASLSRIRANESRKFSHVASSKTLYFARPHVFVAWDNKIKDTLEHRHGTVEEYVDYLEGVRGTLLAIKKTYKAPDYDLDKLPGEIGQAGCTAPEVINKFYWVKTHPKNG